MRTAIKCVIVLLLSINIFAFEVADGWILRQITNTEYIPYHPASEYNENNEPANLDISGATIVWQEYVNGGLSQIMLWNGNTITQISDGTNQCEQPRISGSNVIWREKISGTWQVIFWNGTTQTQISSAANNCNNLQLSNNNVIWTVDMSSWPPYNGPVMLWNGASTRQISGSNYCNSPRISGDYAAWIETDYDVQAVKVMLRNGSTANQVSSTSSCSYPSISGDHIAWIESDKVMLWNGSSTAQISDTTNDCHWPEISDGNVVWTEDISGERYFNAVTYWGGTNPETLRSMVNRKIIESKSVISGADIMWAEMARGEAFQHIRSIYYSDGSVVSKLVDIPISTAYCISGSNIAFTAYDEDHHCQVYLLQPGTPAPTVQTKAADLNKSNTVDIADLSIMMSQWLGMSDTQIAEFSLDLSPQWTNQGDWEFGRPQGSRDALYGNPDPITGYTGCCVYGMNLKGDYSTTVGGPYYLTTNPIDCSHFNNVALNFAQWLNVDAGDKVLCTVEVSNNGSTWTTVWTNPAGTPVTDDQWQQVQYNISSLADGQSAVSIRWGYEVVDAGAQAYSGWNIDDIQLWGESNQ